MTLTSTCDFISRLHSIKSSFSNHSSFNRCQTQFSLSCHFLTCQVFLPTTCILRFSTTALFSLAATKTDDRFGYIIPILLLQASTCISTCLLHIFTWGFPHVLTHTKSQSSTHLSPSDLFLSVLPRGIPGVILDFLPHSTSIRFLVLLILHANIL